MWINSKMKREQTSKKKRSSSNSLFLQKGYKDSVSHYIPGIFLFFFLPLYYYFLLIHYYLYHCSSKVSDEKTVMFSYSDWNWCSFLNLKMSLSSSLLAGRFKSEFGLNQPLVSTCDSPMNPGRTQTPMAWQTLTSQYLPLPYGSLNPHFQDIFLQPCKLFELCTR